MAELTYHDERFPGQVKLSAFNPFIPLNDLDSSIPAAMFEFSITNSTVEPVTYTLAGVLCNPLPAENLNRVEASPWGHVLHLSSTGVEPGSPTYGDLTRPPDAGLAEDTDVSWQQYWFRGFWFDSLEVIGRT